MSELLLYVIGLGPIFVWWYFTHGRKQKPPRQTDSITINLRTARGDQAEANQPTKSISIDVGTALRAKGPKPMRWSGTVTGPLPIKVLTRPQIDCLDSASYGARIVGVPPSEMYFQQPENTSSHATKTVQSLVKHGFLADDGKGGYIITDLGLRAHETCSVRW